MLEDISGTKKKGYLKAKIEEFETNVRQTEIHTAEPRVPEHLTACEVVRGIEKQKVTNHQVLITSQ
jgi:hypothetical protein